MGIDLYMMLIHESHVFELQIETKFEVCDPCSFYSFNATYVVTSKLLRGSCTSFQFSVQIYDLINILCSIESLTKYQGYINNNNYYYLYIVRDLQNHRVLK